MRSTSTADSRSLGAASASRLEVTEELRSEWLRLVDELRRAIHASVDLDAPPGRLRELADRVRDLAKDLVASAGGAPIPLFQPEQMRPGATQIDQLLPFSPVMGRYNPLAPPLEITLDGDRIRGRVRFGQAFQGAPGLVHGGAVSAVFDELLAMATIARGAPGPTASLTVHYRKPTPLHSEIELEAWVTSVHRRKVRAKAQARIGDAVLVEAEGLFVRPKSSSSWARRRP